MNVRDELFKCRTRRQFFKDCGVGLGTLGLASLLNENLFAGTGGVTDDDPFRPRMQHSEGNDITRSNS